MLSFGADLEDNMIKECKVIMQNSFSSVVLFDNTEVQIPTVSVIEGKAFIKHEGDQYFVVTKNDYEKYMNRKNEKKTTKIKEVNNSVDAVENIVIDNEDNM